MRRGVFGAAVVVLLTMVAAAAACDGGGDDERTPATATAARTESPTGTATPTTPPSPVPSATRSATPGGMQTVASTVQLVDATTGRATTLYESATGAAFDAGFVQGLAYVATAGGRTWFESDGTPATGGYTPVCQQQVTDVATIGGVRFAGVNCGVFSPDGTRMAYQAITGETTLPSGQVVPEYEMWSVDVAARELRLLQQGLVACGGCDGRFGVRWSNNSRYVVYAESGGEQRQFLSDVTVSGATHQLGTGAEIGDAPVWSSNSERVVYPVGQHPDRQARIEVVATGETIDVAAAWPVGMDVRGSYLYSPAWGYDPKQTAPQETVLLDNQGSRVLATLPGAPAGDAWNRGSSRPVARAATGYVAALRGAPGCDGTTVYIEGAQPRCIAGGVAGAVADGGERVAVARLTGTTGPVRGPSFEALSLNLYAVDIVDVATGSVTTVATDLPGWTAPQMTWSGNGERLLILSPTAQGL
ncbi:MAG: hypothetical protein IT303_16185 [Dehalococcoidia bacterium]|nr:hypothetical protein [Dehalococcoidia bacterium]